MDSHRARIKSERKREREILATVSRGVNDGLKARAVAIMAFRTHELIMGDRAGPGEEPAEFDLGLTACEMLIGLPRGHVQLTAGAMSLMLQALG